MSEQVTMWKAEDGKLFESEDLADLYNVKAELIGYVDNYPIHVPIEGMNVYGPEFQSWLDDNPRIFIKLLSEEEL